VGEKWMIALEMQNINGSFVIFPNRDLLTEFLVVRDGIHKEM
jgi:hypothetical protein